MSLDGQTFPTPSRQIVIATALAAVLVVVLVAVYLLVFRQPYAVLFNRLKPADAATIVAELRRRFPIACAMVEAPFWFHKKPWTPPA